MKLEGGNAMLHPIAGTRPRGSPEEDQQFADDLLADEKERAEHLMLVDLGRNDWGGWSEPGSVEVVEFMQIERYSHVMHIVSTVTSHLAEARRRMTSSQRLSPPALCPVLLNLERWRSLMISRPRAGGCMAESSGTSTLPATWIPRSQFGPQCLRDGIAYVQAGAGLVADSDPAAEQAECQNKAAAVLRAIAVAQTLGDVAR